MSFQSHIHHLSQRLSRIAALIFKAKNLMPQLTLKVLYHAHVSAALSYCNKIWANTYQTHLNPLFILQKRIVRTLTNSDYLAHTLPLFKQLNILSLENIRKYHLGSYFFKNRNTLLAQLQSHHIYFTRNRDRLHPVAHVRTIFEKSFCYQVPKFWAENIYFSTATSSEHKIHVYYKILVDW